MPIVEYYQIKIPAFVQINECFGNIYFFLDKCFCKFYTLDNRIVKRCIFEHNHQTTAKTKLLNQKIYREEDVNYED